LTSDHTVLGSPRKEGSIRGKRGLVALGTGLVAATALAGGLVPSARAAANWSAYLNGPGHSSTNAAATAITPSNVSSLSVAWNWKPSAPTKAGQPNAQLYASPTVHDGVVYIGANTGEFYALNEKTGSVLWHRFLGYVTRKTLSARGITSTAAIARNPNTKQLNVYVAGGDGYLYALRASDGATVWRTPVAIPSTMVNDYYNWASPTVAGGRIFMGISSQGDNPLVRGGVRTFDQATGAVVHTYYAMPPGTKGASVWSSIGADRAGTEAYVTTGNPSKADPGDGNAIVRLGHNGRKVAIWRVPAAQQVFDSDFGASPTLFSVVLNGKKRDLVGACNKNGIFYTLQRGHIAAGPLWQRRLGAPSTEGPGLCLAAAIWDGSRLFVTGSGTTIDGTAYRGSIRRLKPRTGAIVWERGLEATVFGTPSLNGSNVIAAASYDSGGGGNFLYFLDARTGVVLRRITVSGNEFAQPVFADGYVMFARVGGGLRVYEVGP
jgi:outer membrane protein assembly factor BamB